MKFWRKGRVDTLAQLEERFDKLEKERGAFLSQLTIDIEKARITGDRMEVRELEGLKNAELGEFWSARQFCRTQIILEKLRRLDASFPSKHLKPDYWTENFEMDAVLSEAGTIAALDVLDKAVERDERRKEAAWTRRTTTLSLSIALASLLLAPLVEKFAEWLFK